MYTAFSQIVVNIRGKISTDVLHLRV